MEEVISVSNSMPEQRTQAWLDFRRDRITGSVLGDILGYGFYGKTAKREALFNFCRDKPKLLPDNEHLKRGRECEPFAVKAYEDHTGEEVIELNIVPFKNIDFMAYSPDGLTKSGKLIEIKCPNKLVHGQIKESYKCQMQMGLQMLKEYGMDTTCDFIQYTHPNYNNSGKEMEIEITNIKRDDEWWDVHYPESEEFWYQVLKYRKDGIETHPEYKEKVVLDFREPTPKCAFDL